MNYDLEKLMSVSDFIYGIYAFNFELLNRKISKEKRIEYVNNAIVCGSHTANLYKNKSIYDLINDLNLELIYDEENLNSENSNLLGYFTYPNKITIMRNSIYNISKYFASEGVNISQKEIRECVIAHEIFHYLENKDPKNFYTETEKMTTFKLFKLEFKSRITQISEIAAMSFAKSYTNLKFSPYIFDFALVKTLDPNKAKDFYNLILKIEEEYNEVNNI